MESRARASGEQFSTLLEYMESHGDLAKPQPGAQGRIRADRLWLELANTLNSVGGGVRKTPDKWKKVWADWKSKTKKKALTIRRHASGTGGGPSSRLALTSLEERVLAIIGALAVEGHAEIEEQGFNRPSQSAAQSTAPQDVSESIHLDLDVGVEEGTIPIPPPSPPLRAPLRSSSPPPSTSRRQLVTTPAPTTPPPSTSRQPPIVSSPQSSFTSPRRRHLVARRRRGLTPFDRATSEFVAIEQRRVQLEETRERNAARRIDVDRERNDILRRFAEIAQAWLDQYRSREGHLSSTVGLDTE